MAIKIIAEIGVNHNGSSSLAKQMIDIAADCGADLVKFQSFKSADLVTRSASMAEYQKTNLGSNENQQDMLLKLELSDEQHFELFDYCNKAGIEFLSTPFSSERLDFLVGHTLVQSIKIPSGEITNLPFLFDAGATSLPIILSTGMATLEEIDEALSTIWLGRNGALPRNSKHIQTIIDEKDFLGLTDVTILHCTTEYPAPFESVNLSAIGALQSRYRFQVGYSDHTPGIAVSLAAMGAGAVLIEKHFTLDKGLAGPDHKASLEPQELKDLCLAARQIEASMGSGVKAPQEAELGNMVIARKSIRAGKRIKQGEFFSKQNLVIKRPGDGLSPRYYWDILGLPSQKDYEDEEKIEPV